MESTFLNNLKQTYKSQYNIFLRNTLSTVTKFQNFHRITSIKTNNSTLYLEGLSSIRDLYNQKTKSLKHSFIITNNTSIPLNFEEVDPNLLYSISSNNIKINFIKGKNEDTLLEVYESSTMIYSVNITETYKIKQIYFDNIFGLPKFSKDDSKVVMIGEYDKSKLYKNYFKIKEDSDQDKEKDIERNKNANDLLENNYDKFLYDQDLGESYPDKKTPVILVLDIKEGRLFSVPLDLDEGYLPATPSFFDNNTDILFSCYVFPYFKFGMAYCNQKRESIICRVNSPYYHLEIDKPVESKNKVEVLVSSNNEFYSNTYPILNNNEIYYFSNEKATPHGNGLRFMRYNINNATTEVLIEKINGMNDVFNSLYSYELYLMKNDFINDDVFVFNSRIKNRVGIFLFDIRSRRLFSIQDELSTNEIVKIDKENKLIIFTESSCNKPPRLSLYKYNEKWLEEADNSNTITIEDKVKVSVIKITNNDKVIISNNNENILGNTLVHLKEKEDYFNYYRDILNNTIKEDVIFNNVHGHFIYSNRNLNEKQQIPLIYILHGGPNSVSNEYFSIVQLGFLAHGYSILVVNYPGSVGYGQDYLSSLSGHIGSVDVEACGEFLISALDKYKSIVDSNNVIAYGGSHGGYLSCWLLGHEKYCSLFSNAVIANPVTDLVSLYGISDIPDWTYEQTINENLQMPISKEDYLKLYDASPVYKVNNVVAPILLLLGKKDKRVVCSNGLFYYHSLKKLNKTIRLLFYPEDGHPLATPETEIDELMNMFKWINDHLK